MTKLVRRPPFRRGEGMTKPEVQERLRRFVGSKGLPDVSMDEGVKAVIDVARLEDPFYAGDPQFWIGGAQSVAAPALNSKIGIQTPNDPLIEVIVDGALISADATTNATLNMIAGGAILLVLATTTNNFLRSRGAQEQGAAVPRTGLLMIEDNTAIGGPGTLGFIGINAQAPTWVPLGMKMFASEQLFVVDGTVNQTIRGTFYGRVRRTR